MTKNAHISLKLEDGLVSVEIAGERVAELELDDEARTLRLVVEYEDGTRTQANIALGR